MHAGGDDHGARGDRRAVGELDAGDPLALDAQPAHATATLLAGERAAQRGDELARVDRVVALDVEREADRRRQRRLQAPRLRRPQALDRQAELGAGRRRGDRAPRPRRGRARRPSCPSCGSPGPRARRRSPRSGARSPCPAPAARARRTRPRRPARASPRRRATRRARRRRSRRRARRAAAPARRRRGRSRHHRRRRRRSSRTGLALRLRPPYAGTTRIRFDGRRPDGALSARLRAPVFCGSWYPLMGDATRAPRHRPPVPRLPRACRGSGSRPAMRGGVDLIQLRDKTLDDDGLVAAPRAFRRPRRAVHPQRPAGPGRGVRRRRHPRRPGRRPARRSPGRRSGRTGSSAARRTRPTRPRRRRPTRTSTTSRSARCTRRRPSRDAPAAGLHVRRRTRRAP